VGAGAKDLGHDDESSDTIDTVSASFTPLKFLVPMFAGWVSRHQLDMIEYLQEENRVLKERLGGRRLRFTDAERRRLARKAQALGRSVLNKLEHWLRRTRFYAGTENWWRRSGTISIGGDRAALA
jgi:hypothetical protein